MEPTPDRNVFQRIMSRIREGREGESDLSASEMPASMDMNKPMVKTAGGVKMPMKPPPARVASPAPRPVTAAPDPVMAAVSQETPQMGAGSLGRADVRSATTPAAPAAPRGPGTAPSMSEPQQWGGKGGYFYDYKPSKGTKGTPGYRPATITMHGGKYNNTAGTTIDESHTHFDGIIEELDTLGDNKSPFMTLGAYQRQQAAQGNPTDTESALSAAAAELIPEPEPVPVLAPAPEPAPPLAAEPGSGEAVDALRPVVPMDGGREPAPVEPAPVEPAPVEARRPLRGDPAGYPDALPSVPRSTGLGAFASNVGNTQLGRIGEDLFNATKGLNRAVFNDPAAYRNPDEETFAERYQRERNEAAQTSDQIIPGAPGSAPPRYQLALSALRRGDFEQTERLARLMMEADPALRPVAEGLINAARANQR